MMNYQLFQNMFALADGFQIWLCNSKGERLSLVFRTVDRREAYRTLDRLNA